MKNPPERRNLPGGCDPSSGTLPYMIAVAPFVLIIAFLYFAQAALIPVAPAILLTCSQVLLTRSELQCLKRASK